MSDYTSLVREINALVDERIAKALAPTGVTPGVYNSVTVDARGFVRYGATGGGMTLVAVARGSSYITFTGTVPANTERGLNYDEVLYNPGSAITTGTAWSYTAPSTGWYQVHIAAGLKRATGATAAFDGQWDAYIFVDSTGGTTLPSTVWDQNDLTTSGNNPDLYMRGAAHCYVSAGGVIQPKVGWQPADGTSSALVRYESIVIFKC